MSKSQPNTHERAIQLVLTSVQTNNDINIIKADIVTDSDMLFGKPELLISLPEDTTEFCLSEKHLDKLYNYFHDNKHYVEP